MVVAGFDTAEFGDVILQCVVAIGGLAGVGVASGFLYRFGGADIHVTIGGELQSVFAVGDFVVFAFDAQRRLAYRGRFDESRPGSSAPLTGRDLRAALDSILAGRAPVQDQMPSVGCGIKWKAGDVPA